MASTPLLVIGPVPTVPTVAPSPSRGVPPSVPAPPLSVLLTASVKVAAPYFRSCAAPPSPRTPPSV